jgi:hypothetical protein
MSLSECRGELDKLLRLRRGMSLFAACLVAVGCSTQAPQPTQATIPPGTPVQLVLAKQINAGDAEEGTFVPFLVAEDVQVGGKVLIPKGTLATGKVTWSRSEGTLSGLINQPARLEVQIESLKLDSAEVPLAVELNDPKKPYSFTRENTGSPSVDDAKVEQLLKDELNRKLAEKLGQLFDGKSPDMSTPESQAALQKIAGEMGLTDTNKLLSEGKSNLGTIAGTIERLQRGDLSGIAKGDLSLSLGAVMELANLVGGLGDRISRTIKGRTIRAYPGTKVRAYVALPTVVPLS